MFKDDPYKIDLINEFPDGEVITCYTQGGIYRPLSWTTC